MGQGMKRIKGIRTGRFVAINANGDLYSTVHCHFKESYLSSLCFSFLLYKGSQYKQENIFIFIIQKGSTSRGGVTPYGEAPPERGNFCRLQVYEWVGISLVEVYKRVRKSVTWVSDRAQKSYKVFL